MGFDCAWIVSECSADELERAIAKGFPEFEVVDRVEAPGRDDLIRMDQRVLDTKDQALVALAFYNDGLRGVCVDGSVTMTTATEELAKLSQLVGSTLVLYVATHSGCAGFEFFKEGRSVRKVDNVSGELTFAGEPIKEEKSLRGDSFYMDEADALWSAFGMERPPGDWKETVSLVLYRDHACERDLDKQMPGWRERQPPKPKPRRPWWKFW